ncbi:FxsA family protein [Indiicoccus explosivorum]|uniref:FxsA family protein n=1 Tax=Indiicoccus explosivorum TaxID=1917864 RepID=UPI000B447C7B|nr:FxsA family protein [Indiicoccus explosivorum]
MKWLVPAFVIVPAVELALLMWAGDVLGIVPTLLLILFTGVAGAYLAKQQGLRAIRDIQETTAAFEPPGDALLRGAFILAGGLLLLTPGFLSDLTGLALLFRPTQNAIKPFFMRMIRKRMKNGQVIIMK